MPALPSPVCFFKRKTPVAFARVCEISSVTTTARMILLLRILTSLLQLSCAFSHFCSMCKLSIYRVVLPGELIAVHPFPKER